MELLRVLLVMLYALVELLPALCSDEKKSTALREILLVVHRDAWQHKRSGEVSCFVTLDIALSQFVSVVCVQY